MNRFQALFLSSFVVLGLASCGEPQTSAPASPAASTSMTSGKPAAGFTALQGVTDSTTLAVKAEKFDQAKTEFGKFEDSWKTVEDGVRTKSSDTYKAIEAGLDTVNGELKNNQPDKAKMLSALQSLAQSIASAAKL
jgi:hypothetical protein